MDGVHREGGKADGDVFGAAFGGRGILNPLATTSDDGLSSGNVEDAVFVLHPE